VSGSCKAQEVPQDIVRQDIKMGEQAGREGRAQVAAVPAAVNSRCPATAKQMCVKTYRRVSRQAL
jgi:hypothetical protein